MKGKRLLSIFIVLAIAVNMLGGMMVFALPAANEYLLANWDVETGGKILPTGQRYLTGGATEVVGGINFTGKGAYDNLIPTDIVAGAGGLLKTPVNPKNFSIDLTVSNFEFKTGYSQWLAIPILKAPSIFTFAENLDQHGMILFIHFKPGNVADIEVKSHWGNNFIGNAVLGANIPVSGSALKIEFKKLGADNLYFYINGIKVSNLTGTGNEDTINAIFGSSTIGYTGAYMSSYSEEAILEYPLLDFTVNSVNEISTSTLLPPPVGPSVSPTQDYLFANWLSVAGGWMGTSQNTTASAAEMAGGIKFTGNGEYAYREGLGQMVGAGGLLNTPVNPASMSIEIKLDTLTSFGNSDSWSPWIAIQLLNENKIFDSLAIKGYVVLLALDSPNSITVSLRDNKAFGTILAMQVLTIDTATSSIKVETKKDNLNKTRLYVNDSAIGNFEFTSEMIAGNFPNGGAYLGALMQNYYKTAGASIPRDEFAFTVKKVNSVAVSAIPEPTPVITAKPENPYEMKYWKEIKGGLTHNTLYTGGKKEDVPTGIKFSGKGQYGVYTDVGNVVGAGGLLQNAVNPKAFSIEFSINDLNTFPVYSDPANWSAWFAVQLLETKDKVFDLGTIKGYTIIGHFIGKKKINIQIYKNHDSTKNYIQEFEVPLTEPIKIEIKKDGTGKIKLFINGKVFTKNNFVFDEAEINTIFPKNEAYAGIFLQTYYSGQDGPDYTNISLTVHKVDNKAVKKGMVDPRSLPKPNLFAAKYWTEQKGGLVDGELFTKGKASAVRDGVKFTGQGAYGESPEGGRVAGAGGVLNSPVNPKQFSIKFSLDRFQSFSSQDNWATWNSWVAVQLLNKPMLFNGAASMKGYVILMSIVNSNEVTVVLHRNHDFANPVGTQKYNISTSNPITVDIRKIDSTHYRLYINGKAFTGGAVDFKFTEAEFDKYFAYEEAYAGVSVQTTKQGTAHPLTLYQDLSLTVYNVNGQSLTGSYESNQNPNTRNDYNYFYLSILILSAVSIILAYLPKVRIRRRQ